MKRGLFLTLVTVAISLLCVSGFAYAPIIGQIPDVYIGDNEDNAGTADINLFRFSDAFNFDMYVSGHPSDTDFATTEVRWSFISDAAGEITINGIAEISDSMESIQPDLVSKELTGYPNNDPVGTTGRAGSWATFYDLVDSPIASGPVWPDPTTPLDTFVTVYASNGTKADSKTIAVVAIDDSFDKVSQSGPELVKHYVDPPGEGWAKSTLPSDGFFVNAKDGAFYIATHSTDGTTAKIQGRTSGTDTNGYFGSWTCPDTDIAYEAGKVFRVKYKIKTDQTNPENCPDARLLTEFTDGSSLLVAYGNRIHRSPFSPTPAGKWYNVYVGGQNDYSPDCTNLRVKFDLINVDTPADEWGNLYLMECIVEKFDVMSKGEGTLEKTYDTAADFAPWTTSPDYSGFGIGFGPVTHGTSASGLSIQSGLALATGNQVDYGFWECVSDVYYETDKLYRAIFSLSSPDATLSKWRILARKNDGDWSAQLIADPFVHRSQMPGSTAAEYDLWYETVPSPWTQDNADVNNRMVFAFDVQDVSSTDQGTLLLDKMELYSYDIP